MKGKKVWYLGYVVAAASLIACIGFGSNEIIQTVLILVFSITLSVTHVNVTHEKMMERDDNYRISVNDERNEKIRDKVNAMMASILMLIMGIVAVICFVTKAYLPGGLLAAAVGASPLVMYFINLYYERKY